MELAEKYLSGILYLQKGFVLCFPQPWSAIDIKQTCSFSLDIDDVKSDTLELYDTSFLCEHAMGFCKFHISFVMVMCYHLGGGGGRQSLWGGDFVVVVFLLPTQTEVSISVDPTQECPGTGGIRLGP